MENLNAEIITQSNSLEKDGIDPFINAEISKAIMIRSRMRNRFMKYRSDENSRLFQKQRNKCITSSES